MSLTVPRGGSHRRLDGAIPTLARCLPDTSRPTPWAIPSPARHGRLWTWPGVCRFRRPSSCSTRRPDSLSRPMSSRPHARPTATHASSRRFGNSSRRRLARGIASLTQAISLADACRESAVESLSAGHIFQAGLPTPLFQEPIPTNRGVLYPDRYWPEQRLVGEADGAVKYRDPDAFVKEKEREQILRDHDYRFVRWLGKEIMTTHHIVVGRIARALEAA